MRHRLFRKGLSLAAAVPWVAVCALWVRSHVVRDYAWAFLPWPADAEGRRWLKLDVDSGGGQVEVDWKVWSGAHREQLRQQGGIAAHDSYHRAFPEVPRQYARLGPPTAWNAVGFMWWSGATHTGVWLPYWALALLAAVPPAAQVARAAARASRRRRASAGYCTVCGYDLRATPEPGGARLDRCPECGSLSLRIEAA